MRLRPVPTVSAIVIVSITAVLAMLPNQRRLDRAIVALARSSNGQVAAATAQGRITVWNDRSPLHFESDFGVLNDLQFSPDGQSLAAANRRLTIFSGSGSSAPRILRDDDQNYGTARFSPDGKSLLTVNGKAEMLLIDIGSGAMKAAWCCSTIAGGVDFTPDGQRIVSAGHGPRVWSLSGDRLGWLAPERSIETLVSIAVNSRRVFMGSQDGRVYAWDLSSMQMAGRSPAETAYVDTIAAMDDGSIVYGWRGGSVRMWNPETGDQRLLTSMHPSSNVIQIPNSDSIMYGTAEGTVEVRSIRDERLIQVIE